MKKNNIGVLISIILLLIVFLPCAIYGTYMHLKNDAHGGNINKEFYYNGKLHFYDGNNLLSTYTCKTEKCGYSKNDITSTYEFESFNNSDTEITKINNKYAFVLDGSTNYLVDLNTGKSIVEYLAVKNYSKGITNNQYIVQNSNGLWGMLEISESIKITMPFEYKYLGLINETDSEGLIATNKIVAQKNNKWLVLNSANSILVENDNEIKNVYNKFIITTNNKIYDYQNTQLLSEYNFNDIIVKDKIIIGLSSEIYYIYNSATASIIGSLYKESNKTYDFIIKNDLLVIKADDMTIKTIALN